MFRCMKAGKVLNIRVSVVANLCVRDFCACVYVCVCICAAASLYSQNKERLTQRDGSLLLTDELAPGAAVDFDSSSP